MNKILLYISLSLLCPSFAYAMSHTTYSDGTFGTTQEYGDISHTEYSDGAFSSTYNYGDNSHTEYSDGSSSDSMYIN